MTRHGMKAVGKGMFVSNITSELFGTQCCFISLFLLVESFCSLFLLCSGSDFQSPSKKHVKIIKRMVSFFVFVFVLFSTLFGDGNAL